MQSFPARQPAAAPRAMADRLLDRYQGCLVGLATGDALGAPVEFLTQQQIREKFGVLRDMVGGGWLFVAPGEHTDDTQMSVCVTMSLIEREGFDPADLARRFVEWFTGKPKDVGNTVRVALNFLLGGSPWNQAGALAHARLQGYSAGNGALMRAAPIALAGRALPTAELIRWTDEASLITHWDQRARWAASALNLGIVAGLGEASRQDLVGIVAPQVSEPEVRAAIEAVPTLETAAVRTTGYAVDTLQAAYWCVVHTSSFEEALVAAVNFGDDADTTGAITGALAGSLYGLARIPERWRAVLKADRPLLDLAQQLLILSERLRGG